MYVNISNIKSHKKQCKRKSDTSTAEEACQLQKIVIVTLLKDNTHQYKIRHLLAQNVIVISDQN